jgi:hypothetical protein
LGAGARQQQRQKALRGHHAQRFRHRSLTLAIETGIIGRTALTQRIRIQQTIGIDRPTEQRGGRCLLVGFAEIITQDLENALGLNLTLYQMRIFVL